MQNKSRNKQDWLGPITTVTAIITKQHENDLKILLTQRAVEPFKNKWCLPGGHINQFERSYDAIMREIYEETGLVFKGEPIGTFDEIFPDKEIHNIVIAYEGTGSGAPIPNKNEVNKMEWFTIKEALEQDMAFENKKVLIAFEKKMGAKIISNEKDGLLEEFRALREEMTSIFNARLWGTATYLVLVGGIIGCLGGNHSSFHWLFLIYASIPFILHTAYRERARIRAGVYIKEMIEPFIPGLDWERFVDTWRMSLGSELKKPIWDRVLHMIGISGLFLLIIAVSALKCIEYICLRWAMKDWKFIVMILLLSMGLLLAVLSVHKFFKIYEKDENRTKDVCSNFSRNFRFKKC